MICEVEDGVCFGRKLREHEVGALVHHQICAVLDLTAEYSDPCEPMMLPEKYANIPVLDLTRPGIEQMLYAADWIEAQRLNGKVFIHCSLGLSRSAVMVASWLIATGRVDSIDRAVERVRECNPTVILTEAHRLSLRELVEVVARAEGQHSSDA